MANLSWAALQGTNLSWAALKDKTPKGTNTNLRSSAGSCNFLRFPGSKGTNTNLRFSAGSVFPNPYFSRKRRESAKISENQRNSALGLSWSP